MTEAHEATYDLESINWLSYVTFRTTRMRTCAVQLIYNKYNVKRQYIT